ncbi:MAG: hypothetical protein ACYTXT_06240 [Nostoc sp.]
MPNNFGSFAIYGKLNGVGDNPVEYFTLKVAANSGQNPGFDFLQECWNDDPALVIVIKKLLAKGSNAKK